MEIAYVVSQYPARSETFIAREMKQLLARGNRLLIAPLRWSDTGEGIRVEGADVLGLQWNPLDWVLSFAWAVSRCPRKVVRMGRDLCTAPLFSATWWRLLILGLVSLALARELSDRSVDHLRAHFLDSEAIAAFWVSRLLDVPFSITIHTRSTRFPPSLLRRIAQATSFCAATGTATKRMVRRMANRHNRIDVVRNGVPLPSTLRSRSFPVASPVWRLLSVGRLVEKKGFDTLLEACRLLQDWGRPFRCHIIGDGPCKDRLVAQARRLRIERHVTFYGAKPNEEVYRALQQHDVLVAPCRLASDGNRDGLPTVLMEALSCGVPVVASAFAAIPELVAEGKTGRLVSPDSSIALARALRRLFDRPRHAFRMGRRGREQVRRQFQLEREVETLDAWIHTTSRVSVSEKSTERAHSLS